ncbi:MULTISPECIES: hypothetical protein [Chromobacterium]|uniref:hypothetical protein n=1 Tax=Chromobacterium TaxID=535 RepID=UPI0009EFF213|nr:MULTISPECIES: hypothetical protein [Chromobacterium]MDH0341681.1 hypothetical protein [Chromobacterium haemolyticum]OQS37881.1 hypothetical protein B0T40_07090 [Chromobacterium haemolyticum]BBH11527.1 hypothetical protein CH06BL_07750 [Chromobacterium haemolyticum]
MTEEEVPAAVDMKAEAAVLAEVGMTAAGAVPAEADMTAEAAVPVAADMTVAGAVPAEVDMKVAAQAPAAITREARKAAMLPAMPTAARSMGPLPAERLMANLREIVARRQAPTTRPLRTKASNKPADRTRPRLKARPCLWSGGDS